MHYTIDFLKQNSKLPGPSANLTLLYDFIEQATDYEIAACFVVTQVDMNTPEEFVLVCGVAASIKRQAELKGRVDFNFVPFAKSDSWRVREAVCIGFQRSMKYLTAKQMHNDLKVLRYGNALELRTYVATICEPRLLVDYLDTKEVLDELLEMTLGVFKGKFKLDEDLRVLRQALGYCWSVALCGPGADLSIFEQLLGYKDQPHILWIIKENLKKKRLEKLNTDWVKKMYECLGAD